MSAFDELRQLFTKAADAGNEYRMRTAYFAPGFTQGFREYIGAPEHYLAIDRKTKKSYVEAQKIEQDSSGRLEFTSTEDLLELVTQGEDGFWSFGVRLVLDRGENAFPKAAFGYHIRFRLKEDKCVLTVADKSFSFDMTNNPAMAAAYDYMVGLLKDAFTREPCDVVKKQSIGFVSFAMPPS
jgi:hypothetical protein